jgi:hypothetical protein
VGKQTFFAYALGADHEAVVDAIERRLDALVAERAWMSKDVWVVNQREPPHWDLGLNMDLGAARTRPAGWIEDVVAIAETLAELHRETGKRFVLGVAESGTDQTQDLFTIENASPDLDALRAAFAPKAARKRA